MIRRLALVFSGGCLGTLARWSLSHLNTFLPFGTLIVNVAGAFFLGLLLAFLAKNIESANPEALIHRNESLRIFLGVGVLGSFTTYSALSVEAIRLIQTDPLAGFSYSGISVLAGVLAAWCGMRVAR